MLCSARWLNDYLDPPASPDEMADLLTRAGFPLEGSEDVEVSDGTDVRQDYEMTSNRGDCTCHVGLAREIVAISGRSLKAPAPAPRHSATKSSDLITVENHEPTRCPLYTGRVIRGLTVRPSPTWLQDRLVARGDIPRNNVVDATNFVLFEMGQPTHCFDLALLRGAAIHVRMAHRDEPFLPIGEGEAEVALSPEDLVIADAERAVAIAGVKGGAVTAVTDGTTDVLLEAASFDPVCVRTTSRRLGIASDSSYRFERGVHPGQVNEAADRLAELILDLAGGELCAGVVADGAPIPPRGSVSMRTERCRALLGVPVTDEQMMNSLAALGFEPTRAGERIECVVPVHRLDIDREIDLIEEVGRVFGLDNIPVAETIEIRVAPPQPTELAHQAVADALVGMGFVETITHTLVAEDAAAPFLEEGDEALHVDDERAGAEPVLQPSLLPSLLRVRRHNLDQGMRHLRLFESAATFRRTSREHDEREQLGLLMDWDKPELGIRPMRGVVERIVQILLGAEVTLDVAPDETTRWLSPGVTARAAGRTIGRFGLLTESIGERFGLDQPVLVAELDILPLYEGYPPETAAHALPSFPAIERDLSVLVDEGVSWQRIEEEIRPLGLEFLEAAEFVTVYRGRQVGGDRKSMTFRLRFRSADRTLTHDEVDPQVAAVVARLEEAVSAELRKQVRDAPR